MCTSICYRNKDCYFGRNLDVEFSFLEEVVITPRNRTFHLKNKKVFQNRYALMGMASVIEDFPLYYECVNEKGLACAGLNFPYNAFYSEMREGKENLTPFELIPYVLGTFSTIKEARNMLEQLCLVNLPFSEEMPLSPLHFMFSDREESLVLEQTKKGLFLYDNPYEVMTNNPPFPKHLQNMEQYKNLSPKNKERKENVQDLSEYCVGKGAVGLPGDASSLSRFARASFHLENSRSSGSEEENVQQFFHVLDSVSMVKGATVTDSGKDDITLYSCCINLEKRIYYYKTYGNNRITAVRLTEKEKNKTELLRFPLHKKSDILYEN